MLLQNRLIDFKLLANACAFYSAHGYSQIEVPWIVNPMVSMSTFEGSPESDIAFKLDSGHSLVCSAEQGFVSLMLDDKLTDNTKYFSISPCFRNERMDDTHSKWFIKLELFAYSTNNAKFDETFKSDALKFFGSCGLNRSTGASLKSVDTSEGTDIYAELKRHDGFYIEIGSYGVRDIEGYTVSYGTGAALPRLSAVIEESERLSIGSL